MNSYGVLHQTLGVLHPTLDVGGVFNDRYDDMHLVRGILWFRLLQRLICHCNRLDLHATFVGVAQGWREVAFQNAFVSSGGE